ncbi:MAG: hypothetical protein JRG80_06640 [Deltaproteobacteria bacterium]|nr:hypothetical protein [Deltaproteobacteria bacterium]MBW2398935.1 hypothetical protein [Deltaproteobacteria bacterium]MBW2665135.1 hypothetical protein [Deltaproteobacteria bacterium]
MKRSTLRTLGDLLDTLSLDWVLIGALAANRYRTAPRLTQAVDLLLADAGPGLAELEDALRSAGWDVQRASPEAELIRLRHPEHGIADIEAILASKTPLDESYIEHWATYWDVLTTWHSLR